MQEIHNKDLYEMCLAHFNEPMLASFDLVRCIGYGETAVDGYIIARGQLGETHWLTCVGGYTFLDRLKGQRYVLSTLGEHCDDLTRLDRLLALNGCPQETEFRIDLQHDDWEGGKPREACA